MMFSDKGENVKSRQQQTMEQLYLDKEETGDVTFIVESETVRAHRNVLAAISPKYKAQFYGIQPDKGDIIVKDVTAAAFKEFLQFFYLEKVNLTEGNIEDVLNLAKQSLVEHFVDDCVSRLFDFIWADVNAACLVYRLALLHNIKELIGYCELFISENIMGVFKSDGFTVNCDQDMLLQILKLESLNCKERNAFEACISWAKAVCKSKDLDGEKMENVRAELGDAIYEIRFRSMKIEEFAQLYKLHEGLFTAEEMLEIVYLIGDLKDFRPSKFSDVPRQNGYEVNRTVRVPKEERKKRSCYPVPVIITCTQAICFRGFATAFQLPSNEHKLLIKITNVNGTCREFEQKYIIKSQGDDETIVSFEKSIYVEPGSAVKIAMEGPHFEISTKYAFFKKVTRDNCKFSFELKGDPPGILLKRLFFNKI